MPKGKKGGLQSQCSSPLITLCTGQVDRLPFLYNVIIVVAIEYTAVSSWHVDSISGMKQSV